MPPITNLEEYISRIVKLDTMEFYDLNSKEKVSELNKNIPEISKRNKHKESSSLINYTNYKINEFAESRLNRKNGIKGKKSGKATDSSNRNKSNSSSSIRYFYRGQYDSKAAMKSGIYRSKNQNKEDFFYHEILTRCPDDFKNTTHLEKLAIMQHYGVPTRLLDITANPLVALYFACKNYGRKNRKNSKSCNEGIVYVFRIEADDLSYFDSDRALILSCLPKFKASEKKTILKLAVKNLHKDEFPLDSEGIAYDDVIIERLYHEICSEAPAFTRSIKPIDLLSPLFVQPSKNSKRILRQFIISGLSADTYEEIFKLHVIISHTEIGIKNQDEILKQLDKIGINEATLFPEIDHVATYLKSL